MKLNKEFLRRSIPLTILGVVVIGMLTSCVHSESPKTQELQTMFTSALSGSAQTCLDNYGEYKDTIVANIQQSQSDLLSEHYYLREPAIQAVAWQFIAPNDSRTLYETYFQKIANINPHKSSFETENKGYYPYLITLDNATKVKPEDQVDSRKLAEALCETTFRTYKLIEHPDTDEWKQDSLTFSAVKTQLPGVVWDSGKKTFRAPNGADGGVTLSSNQFKINIAGHKF